MMKRKKSSAHKGRATTMRLVRERSVSPPTHEDMPKIAEDRAIPV